MAKVLGDNIVSKGIDYLKNFNIKSNILIPIFLGMEFLRKTYILNVPLLGIQTTVISMIKSKGPEFYSEFLEIFSKLKIKNYSGKALIDSLPSNFTNVSSLEEIWKIIKLNLSENIGNDLLKYINDYKKDFSKKALKDDIKDIELGIKIYKKVNETLLKQDQENKKSTQEGGFFYIRPEEFQRNNNSSNISSDLSSETSDIETTSIDSDNILKTSDISEFLTDGTPVFTSDISSVRSSEISPVRTSEISTVSSVMTDDIQDKGLFGIFMKPVVNSEEISEVTPIKTEDISTVSTVFSDEIQNGFLDIFVENNIKSSEISPVASVNTSSLSNIYHTVSQLSNEFTPTVSSVTNSDTEYLMNKHPEIFAKHGINELKSTESSISIISSDSPESTDIHEIESLDSIESSKISNPKSLDNNVYSETDNSFDSNIWLSSTSK